MSWNFSDYNIWLKNFVWSRECSLEYISLMKAFMILLHFRILTSTTFNSEPTQTCLSLSLRPSLNKKRKKRSGIKQFFRCSNGRIRKFSFVSFVSTCDAVTLCISRLKLSLVRGWLDSTEVAYLLLTQQPRVRFSAFPRIFLLIYWRHCLEQWTEAWKCQSNPSSTGKLVLQKSYP